MAATRPNNSYPRALYRRQRSRIGHPKAIGAVKHPIIGACRHMLTTGGLYSELDPDYYSRRHPERATNRLVAQLQRSNTPSPPSRPPPGQHVFPSVGLG